MLQEFAPPDSSTMRALALHADRVGHLGWHDLQYYQKVCGAIKKALRAGLKTFIFPIR